MGAGGVAPLKRKLHLTRRHPWLFLQTGRPVIWRRRARRFDLEKVEEGRYRRRRWRRAGAAVRTGLISRACRRMRSADSERRRRRLRLQQWRYVSLQIRSDGALKWSKNVAKGKFRRLRRGLVFCSTFNCSTEKIGA